MKRAESFPIAAALLILMLLVAGFGYLATSAQAQAREADQDTCADFVGPLTPNDEALNIEAYRDITYLEPSSELPPALDSLSTRAGFSLSIGTAPATWAETLGS
ncbi:MAG: hypothetical protein JXB38_00540, partial [Anaerolineales bacterium]|nr:hypothetical protein [Anaerolineales bacterium]